MQNLPEAPDRKWGDAYMGKRKRFTLTKAEPLRWKEFLPSCHSQVAHLFCQVNGLCTCGLCLLLVSQYSETSNMKTPQDMTTPNLNLSAIKRLVNFNAWKKNRSLIVNEDISSLQSSCKNPKWNKVEIKKKDTFFLPSALRKQTKNIINAVHATQPIIAHSIIFA